MPDTENPAPYHLDVPRLYTNRSVSVFLLRRGESICFGDVGGLMNTFKNQKKKVNYIQRNVDEVSSVSLTDAARNDVALPDSSWKDGKADTSSPLCMS